ncbi:MAG: amidohydrolase family protein [Actinomycetota bacterium]
MTHELVIRGGAVVDGSGAPRRHADVAVDDGVITHVGVVEASGRRELDADGALVTPGFVDIHTHYDGQFCWDKLVTPSSWHGVTTVVAGNCGVGFAPVRPGTEDALVKLMESVEDIPGSALHEGIPWGWETFAEYLDVIDTPYVMDVGTQVPHVAIRHYVMGDRCYDDATADDIAEMARLTREALEAGALGFSTSRFFGHRDADGNLVPGTNAAADEMLGIGDAFAGLGHGTVEIITDHVDDPGERAWIAELARRSGRPVTVLAATVTRDALFSLAHDIERSGGSLRPQVGARPASLLMTLEGTINPLRRFPSYRKIASLPVDEQRRRLRDPELRARILADEPTAPRFAEANRIVSDYSLMYVLPPDLSYEPSDDDSVAGIAARQGIDPREALMDALADGRPLLHLFGRYPGDLEGQREMIEAPETVFGLSDGGAHCGVLCDASVPTYMLAYFGRDRTRGPLMSVEQIVHKMTRDTALTYGMADRGLVAPGLRADLNVIDHDALRLHDPEMVWDLPAGGKRFIQRADGYRATVCAGEVTHEHGEHTGALPGRLVRGG